MYLNATRAANLVLTKAVFQLLFVEVHNLNMRPGGDLFFQITFSNLNGTLSHSETVKRHCNLIDSKPVLQACSQ